MKNPTDRWSIARSRHIPAMWPIIAYFDWPIREHFGIKTTGKIVHIWDKGDLTAIFETEPRKPLVQVVLNILEQNKDSLEVLRKKGIIAGEKIVTYVKNFSKDVTSKRTQEIAEFLTAFPKEHMPLMRDNMFFWLIPAATIEERIKRSLEELSESDISEIFSVLSQPVSPSYNKQIETELSVLVDEAREKGLESQELAVNIKTFTDKYFWFPYEYVGPNIWTIETVRRRIEEEIAGEKKGANQRDILNDQNRIIERFKIHEDVQSDFRLLQNLTLMQDDRKMFMSQICYYLNGVIFSEVARRFNVTLELARFIDAELLSQSESDIEEFRNELEGRSNFVVTIQENQSITINNGQDAREVLDSLGIPYLTTPANVREIKGQVANRGMARGKVRVLKTSQVENFDQGDIIVTGMTTPDFAPLMKKAGAIVTDEGGITCHAAIVSRELNIPCVIGTKNATKILKDGDVVEVNADVGLVKIINSNGN